MSAQYSMKKARIDQRNYVKALINGDLSLCMSIEQYYELFGYSPEIVCIGLAAAVRGEDIDAAIAKALPVTTKDAEVSNG